MTRQLPCGHWPSDAACDDRCADVAPESDVATTQVAWHRGATRTRYVALDPSGRLTDEEVERGDEESRIAADLDAERWERERAARAAERERREVDGVARECLLRGHPVRALADEREAFCAACGERAPLWPPATVQVWPWTMDALLERVSDERRAELEAQRRAA